MKFLCENCKAKYQIADEKVAGRTVKMKCRKCGHMIQLEASVTETSVASRLPTEGQGSTPGSLAPGGGGAVQAAALGLSPKPGLGPPPRPGAPPRPVPAVGPLPGLQAGPPRPPGGLAGAFSKAVAAPRDTPPSVSAAMVVLSSSGTAEEWYVGINGVPVGPVRLSDLRRKAAAGTVTEESLVWREGFEEWVPLRTFPELCALLREATTGYPSLTPPAPTGPAVHVTTRPQPSASLTRSGSAAPRAPAGPSARNNVVPFASRRATAEKVADLNEPLLEEDIRFESEHPSAMAPHAFAAPTAPTAAPVATAHQASPDAFQSLIEHSVPATAAFVASAVPEAPRVDEAASMRAKARAPSGRRLGLAQGMVLVLAGVLGGVGLFIVLFPQTSKAPVQVVSVMVPTPPPPVPTAAATTEEEGTTVVGPIEFVASPTKGGGKAPKTAAATDPAASAAPLGPSLTGLSGLVTGPSGPSGGSAARAGGGGQLTSADIERVVTSHKAFVKRQCWDPASRSGGPSVRVEMTVTVARDGSVQSAEGAGGDTYPGLASCLQGNVKSWKFPPSDGQTFKVPFVFASQ